MLVYTLIKKKYFKVKNQICHLVEDNHLMSSTNSEKQIITKTALYMKFEMIILIYMHFFFLPKDRIVKI